MFTSCTIIRCRCMLPFVVIQLGFGKKIYFGGLSGPLQDFWNESVVEVFKCIIFTL